MTKTKLSIISALFCFGVLFAEGAFADCTSKSEFACKGDSSCQWVSLGTPGSGSCISND